MQAGRGSDLRQDLRAGGGFKAIPVVAETHVSRGMHSDAMQAARPIFDRGPLKRLSSVVKAELFSTSDSRRTFLRGIVTAGHGAGMGGCREECR